MSAVTSLPSTLTTSAFNVQSQICFVQNELASFLRSFNFASRGIATLTSERFGRYGIVLGGFVRPRNITQAFLVITPLSIANGFALAQTSKEQNNPSSVETANDTEIDADYGHTKVASVLDISSPKESPLNKPKKVVVSRSSNQGEIYDTGWVGGAGAAIGGLFRFGAVGQSIAEAIPEVAIFTYKLIKVAVIAAVNKK